jgi:HAD superfamily hydrolase (TIGR01509 family)
MQAIIFDFFDVIRSDPYKAWLERRGFSRQGSFLAASQRLDSGEITYEAFHEILGELSGEPAHKVAEEFAAVTRLDRAVVALIDRLHEHYRTALLSNAPSALIRDILREHDLERRFDEIVVSSEVGLTKPDPKIFALVLDRLAVPASEALFIDDSEHHVAGAEAAGIQSIQFLSAGQLKADLTDLGLKLD